ncbi:hypothetical protein VM1G_11776 [Cytospora mali]|uniref:Uncharacterized protein n=1 Tax=Cytospora mali TaxID=578113 RepID=A0A194W5T8_CYTMA|nr:hypothetical protein VM1G_11776 [Valsa mali]
MSTPASYHVQRRLADPVLERAVVPHPAPAARVGARPSAARTASVKLAAPPAFTSKVKSQRCKDMRVLREDLPVGPV